MTISVGPFVGKTRDAEFSQGWFRLFGYGLSWTDHRRHPPLFSERYGYTRALHVGPWCLRALVPRQQRRPA